MDYLKIEPHGADKHESAAAAAATDHHTETPLPPPPLPGAPARPCPISARSASRPQRTHHRSATPAAAAAADEHDTLLLFLLSPDAVEKYNERRGDWLWPNFYF